MTLPRIGLSAAARALRRRAGLERGAVILMYHRIASDVADPWNLCVSPRHFAEHLDALRSWGDVVPLHRLPDAVAARRRKLIAITFDDGYADNYHAALPALEQRDMPATLFVSTGPVLGGREYWWDALEQLLLGPHDLPPQLMLHIDGAERRWPLTDHDQAYRAIWSLLGPMPPLRQQALLDEIADQIGRPLVTRESHRPMHEEELAQLAARSRDLLRIGGHTVDHPRLPTLPRAQGGEQIMLNKRRLESICGRAVTEFAYPFGAHDQISVELVRQAGFGLACTTAPGAVRRRTDPHRLPRIEAPDGDGDRLLRTISGHIL